MRVILLENREVKMRGKHTERDHADALTQHITKTKGRKLLSKKSRRKRE